MASLSKQETYRLLMKEKKAKMTTTPKIDHPLAKYNSTGQLTCVICTVSIKSELLWQTHLQSKLHKQNVSELKSLSEAKEMATKRQAKTRRTSSTDEDGFVKPTAPPSRKRRLSSQEREEDNDASKSSKEERGVEQVPTVTKTEGLPSDFFDTPTTDTPEVLHETTAGSGKTEKVTVKENKEADTKKDDSSNIPEGFFDNPVTDAKARKVEYKDPLDEQWEAFQKSISKETDMSQAIIEGDDEHMKEDRELSEVNEQVHWYQRAESLRLKQEIKATSKSIKTEDEDEEIKPNTNNSEIVNDENSDNDDTDLSDLFNWRFKSS